MKAPFSWFGGKSRVADLVWSRFGDVPNFCEPFFGSGAVLLGRPTDPGIETVNDLDCNIANFWRALQTDPEGVAHWAEWPVNEADLHARHTWLINQHEFRERMKTDPDYFDVKIAGWWVWGISAWIGNGWTRITPQASLPHLGGGRGVHRKRPHLGGGRGVHRSRPHLGDAGMGVHRKESDLAMYFQALATRLRRVRVCCGEWDRILGPSPTSKLGLTGVFLDPPYTSDRDPNVYNEDSEGLSKRVRDWAIANGDNPLLRIALCGYEGEHEMPSGWEKIAWKAHGGYGTQGNGQGRENSHKERIWFSPHCLKPDLFSLLYAD